MHTSNKISKLTIQLLKTTSRNIQIHKR